VLAFAQERPRKSSVYHHSWRCRRIGGISSHRLPTVPGHVSFLYGYDSARCFDYLQPCHGNGFVCSIHLSESISLPQVSQEGIGGNNLVAQQCRSSICRCFCVGFYVRLIVLLDTFLRIGHCGFSSTAWGTRCLPRECFPELGFAAAADAYSASCHAFDRSLLFARFCWPCNCLFGFSVEGWKWKIEVTGGQLSRVDTSPGICRCLSRNFIMDIWLNALWGQPRTLLNIFAWDSTSGKHRRKRRSVPLGRQGLVCAHQPSLLVFAGSVI